MADARELEKPVPSNEGLGAFQPNEDHEYFEHCGDHLFRHSSDGFEPVNAWWLAEAAMLAYADPRFAARGFESAGLAEVRSFEGESTQCYLAQNEDFVVVAFSGTDLREREGNGAIDTLADWLVNLHSGLVDSGQGGRVHEGFKKALEEVWDPPDRDEDQRLKPYLDEVCEGGRRQVWFTGHSLGAALATLAAGRYEHARQLYTFGSPRVGDRAYAESLRLGAYRFVNGEDLVCRVPLPRSYCHVGSAKYIDSEGRIHEEEAGGLGRALRRSLSRALGAVGAMRPDLIRELPENLFTDHAPLYYAVHTWNDYVRS